jgi:hypothetical protein
VEKDRASQPQMVLPSGRSWRIEFASRRPGMLQTFEDDPLREIRTSKPCQSKTVSRKTRSRRAASPEAAHKQLGSCTDRVCAGHYKSAPAPPPLIRQILQNAHALYIEYACEAGAAVHGKAGATTIPTVSGYELCK